MKSRTTIIYIASGFVVASLISAGYFFFKKPEKIAPPPIEEAKSAIVFKDVKYSGEKKGVIDWEIKGKSGKKYIDKPIVEMEGIDGEYKPKPGTLIKFKGSKGSLNTEQETGTVESVRIIHNEGYTLTTKYMDFDFKKGLTTTNAPVTIEGSRLTLMGVGLIANTKDETIKIVKNVTGFVDAKKGKYRFAGDTLAYYRKSNQFVLDGNAMMSGEDMKVTCSRLYVYTDGEDIEKMDARGKVTGFVDAKKGKYRFAGDTLAYYRKSNQFVLDGNAMMSGEDMKVTCSRLYVYTDGEDIEKMDARGKVRLSSKGSVAKSEQAVYYFKDNKNVSTEPSKTGKDRKGAAGKSLKQPPGKRP
jgi:LPS export ABC transporter protein LptC